MTQHVENGNTASQPASVVAETHSKAAFKAYNNSKDAATEAVAHTFLVYLNTQNSDGADWLKSALDTRNEEIKAHNEAIPQRKIEAADYKAKLASNPKAVAFAQAMKDASLTDEGWAAEERTKIDTPRKGASRFTTICRLVLHFDHSYHASNTSRYCAVLEWLEAKFHNQIVTSIAPLVAAINTAGGFEKVLFMQRRGEPDADGYTVDDRDIIDAAIKEKINAAIASANVKASFSMVPGTAANGDVVIVYGRYDNGTVSVIDEVPLETAEVDGMLRKLNNKAMLPVEEATEFVSRVLSLGELVETGKKTKHRVNNIPGAKQIEVYSLVSMLPDGGDTKLMVSGCMDHCSVVIHAKPLGDIAADLMQAQDHLYMNKRSRKAANAMLHDRTQRTLNTLSRDAVPVLNTGKPSGSAMSWCLTNTALAAKQRKTADHRLFWDYMGKGKYQPVNVEPYTNQFTATVTQTALSELFVEYLKQFKSVSIDKGGAMELLFETGQLTIRYKGQGDQIVPINATLTQSCSIKLRPKDVYGIVNKLKQLDVSVATLSGNINGVFKVSFSDGIGEYDIYTPTCDDEQLLTPKFFEKLLPPPAPVTTNDDEIEGDEAAA
jgi:hypothetical protein